MTKEEAHKQISRNASVFRVILVYVEKQISDRTSSSRPAGGFRPPCYEQEGSLPESWRFLILDYTLDIVAAVKKDEWGFKYEMLISKNAAQTLDKITLS